MVSCQPNPIQPSRLMATSPVCYGWLVLTAGPLDQIDTQPT